MAMISPFTGTLKPPLPQLYSLSLALTKSLILKVPREVQSSTLGDGEMLKLFLSHCIQCFRGFLMLQLTLLYHLIQLSTTRVLSREVLAP